MAAHLRSLSLFFLFVFASNHVSADQNLVLEDGYTVATLLDGHKLNINPHSIHPRSGLSNFLVLDSSGSAFYTVSFSATQESVIKRFSGNGKGFSDGDLASAQFDQPRSFAVDLKGNVYVADRKNFAIRKISESGVTTIAGGISHKIGNADGPAQNASFSTDFELVFVPEKCALLIPDHGNKLVRMINLKPEDCARGSQSTLGLTSVWILGLGLSCLVGLIIGFAVRPYITPHTGRVQPPLCQRDMEALPNPSGETSTDALLRHQKRNC
ncbi:uncharacterized protein LOC131144337 isoform X2 [Malania oleifera]|uniref:uncharacterized protein LOC131144337 isoform X2 n=1 Tax=Malania oleifera TaxID=397392 RepID=UPI0025AE174F|nr:uncharacterized protein LOC131144337 isoform X2 [Malania oleifera]